MAAQRLFHEIRPKIDGRHASVQSEIHSPHSSRRAAHSGVGFAVPAARA
jgi:hypothetical protein